MIPVGHVKVCPDRTRRTPGVFEVPGDQGVAPRQPVLVPEVVVIPALGHAVPGDDPVPIVGQPVRRQVVEEIVGLLHPLDEDLISLLVRFGRGEGLRKRLHAGRVKRTTGDRILKVFLEHPERLDVARPDLLVEHAPTAIAEAIGDESVVDVLDQGEQAQRLAVQFQQRVHRARSHHTGVAEDFIAQDLAHLRLVAVHRVEVEALESVEAQRRIVVIELQLPGQLVASLLTVLEAEAEHAEESLVANPDRLVALTVDFDGRLHVDLGRWVGLELGQLLVTDHDVVRAHRRLVEDDVKRVAALLVDADRGLGRLGRDSRSGRVGRGREDDRGDDQGRGQDQSSANSQVHRWHQWHHSPGSS